MKLITQHQLKEVLQYDPDTGVFTWKSGPRAGLSAGNTSKHNGHHRIMVDRRLYYAHRLAWLYMTGEWPQQMIDHIDHDRANNKWINLREADAFQNQQNSIRGRSNTSGVKGVHYHKQSGKWRARVMAFGKNVHVGLFDTVEEAGAARNKMALALHGEFCCE